MSTRRSGGWCFDHGAQYFTVRDIRFARWVDSWLAGGLVGLWEGTIVTLENGERRPNSRDTERFVGQPGMDAVCAHLAAELDVRFETRVTSLERAKLRWLLDASGERLGSYDAIVVSAPAPQTASLFSAAAPKLAARAATVEFAPCWTAMAAFAAPLDLGFDGAFVHGSPLSWVARNSSKPGRSDGEAWVLHASPEWSQERLELSREEAGGELLEALALAVGGLDRGPTRLDAHRWRFALPTSPLAEPCLFDADLRAAACGDWCGGPRVEAAFLSARAAADRILAARTLPPSPSTYE
jgi:predicted NAD/FAD-dependent oxidoreductase